MMYNFPNHTSSTIVSSTPVPGAVGAGGASSPNDIYLPLLLLPTTSSNSAATTKFSRLGVPNPVTGSQPVFASHPAPITKGDFKPESASKPPQPTELPVTISVRPIEPME